MEVHGGADCFSEFDILDYYIPNYLSNFIMIFIKTLLLFLLIWIFENSFSQNLVPNSDFEIYKICPIDYLSKVNFLPYWYSPTIGTPDYFNKCSKGKAGIPNNPLGYIIPHSGVACVGIIAANLSGQQPDFKFYSREYIAAKLNKKLVKQNKYCVQFYVSLADNCRIAIDKISLFFSKKKVFKLTRNELTLMPQITYQGGRLQNKEDWILICDIYVAKGNEKYLIIGNFQNDNDISWTWLKDENANASALTIGAYYYIDDVSVFPIMNETECGCNKADDKTINQ